MKPPILITTALACMAAFGGVIAWQRMPTADNTLRIVPMIEGCATTIATDFEAFPEDIAAVERAWDGPIPDDFIQIGGIDWFGWAKICRDDEDQPGIFRGEYRDAAQRYVGLWRYNDPQNRSLPTDILTRYQMSHFANNRMTLRNFAGAPDDVVYLEPVTPVMIEAARAPGSNDN